MNLMILAMRYWSEVSQNVCLFLIRGNIPDKMNIFAQCWFPIGNSEFSICTTDGSCDGKTSYVASLPRRLSGPLRVVESGGPADDKVHGCAHDSECHSTVLDSSVVQIESSKILAAAFSCQATLAQYWVSISNIGIGNILSRDIRPILACHWHLWHWLHIDTQ